MKLLYTLSRSQMETLALEAGEEVRYCIPADLTYDNRNMRPGEAYAGQVRLVVTDRRFVVLEEDGPAASFLLAECEKIKCEHQVHCGIVTVTKKDGQTVCAARVSMRHIVRAAYLARGAQTILEAKRTGETPDRVVSTEYEKYCEKCGRALPGTKHCPYCAGRLAAVKKFSALCGEYVGQLLLISLLMILTSACYLALPMVQRNFVDGALATGNGSWRDWGIFAAATLALVTASIVVGVYRHWQCISFGSSLSMSLRRKLYYKIQTLSLSFINSRKPGELLNRVSRDTNQIRGFIEEVFGDMISTILTMVVSLAVMFFISWSMTLLSLASIVVVFLLMKAFQRHFRLIYHKQVLKSDELSNILQDVISGMRVVKCFGKEEREADRFRKNAEEFADMSRKNETFWAVFFPMLTFLLGTGTYIAIYFGGSDVLQGKMTAGQLVQFVAYCGYLFAPLEWMAHLPRRLMQLVTSLNRIYDVLDEEPAIADREDSKEFPIRGAFRFENISFGYHTYEPVLENVNFEVRPGEMIGLVGASGAGKSTLINLIMRLYDVDQGRIVLDGVDLRDIKSESLHSQIGVVLQETFLFSGSILANIRFARQDASLEEVIQAAKAANAHDFICRTPDGYNTYVGEHGYNLSGGERQRVAIARAILNNPRLLILDEATSALDTESEFLIQQALGRLTRGRTTFAIAHRLSTLRNADRLVVIDRHGIAEIGTHNELLEKKGIYYGLVTAQLDLAQQNAG